MKLRKHPIGIKTTIFTTNISSYGYLVIWIRRQVPKSALSRPTLMFTSLPIIFDIVEEK